MGLSVTLPLADLTGGPLTRHNLVDVIPDAASNHNGGTLRFGPDGMLYASLGDDAVPCAAQQLGGLRGLILRMRVDLLPPGPGSAFYAQLTPPDNPFASSSDSAARIVVARGLRNMSQIIAGTKESRVMPTFSIMSKAISTFHLVMM